MIEENLRAARAVVVLWSSEASQSQWVRAEADYARQAGTLVQASLDGTIPPLSASALKATIKDPDFDAVREDKDFAPVMARAKKLLAERVIDRPPSAGRPRS